MSDTADPYAAQAHARAQVGTRVEAMPTVPATAARDLGLAALVEVHNLEECDRALAAGAAIIGVNNRNLRTLQVDLDASRVIAERIPKTVIGISESGLKTRDDLQTMTALGYRAFLMGERFMVDPDPGAALAGLISSLGTATQ